MWEFAPAGDTRFIDSPHFDLTDSRLRLELNIRLQFNLNLSLNPNLNLNSHPNNLDNLPTADLGAG